MRKGDAVRAPSAVCTTYILGKHEFAPRVVRIHWSLAVDLRSAVKNVFLCINMQHTNEHNHWNSKPKWRQFSLSVACSVLPCSVFKKGNPVHIVYGIFRVFLPTVRRAFWQPGTKTHLAKWSFLKLGIQVVLRHRKQSPSKSRNV